MTEQQTAQQEPQQLTPAAYSDTAAPIIGGPSAQPIKIVEAMAGVMADLTAIEKEKRHQHFKFNFRGIDDVYNAIHPLLAKHKIVIAPQVLETRQKKAGSAIHTLVKMRYSFVAVDGSSLSIVVIGEAFDNNDKGIGKAMSYAYKYGIFQAFCVPTEENTADPDAAYIPGAGHEEPAPKAAPKTSGKKQPAKNGKAETKANPTDKPKDKPGAPQFEPGRPAMADEVSELCDQIESKKLKGSLVEKYYANVTQRVEEGVFTEAQARQVCRAIVNAALTDDVHHNAYLRATAAMMIRTGRLEEADATPFLKKINSQETFEQIKKGEKAKPKK